MFFSLIDKDISEEISLCPLTTFTLNATKKNSLRSILTQLSSFYLKILLIFFKQKYIAFSMRLFLPSVYP